MYPCAQHTHTHDIIFFNSRLEGCTVHKNDARVIRICLFKFFLVWSGEGALGTENSPKVAILRRGGRLHLNTALLCFALLS